MAWARRWAPFALACAVLLGFGACSFELPDVVPQSDASAGGSSGAGGSNSAGSGGAGATGGGGCGWVAPNCNTPNLCDDFDTGTLGSKWSGLSSPGGKLSLDTVTFLSPPAGFRSTLEAQAEAGANREARLIQTFPPATAIHCEFDLYIDTVGTGERGHIAQLNVGNPAFSGYNLNVDILEDGTGLLEEWAVLADGGSFIHNTPFDTPAPKTWVHVSLDKNYTSTGSSVSLALDCSPVGQLENVEQTPNDETFLLGAGSGGSQPWAFVFDNVSCAPTL
jgi:hypothetical protein